MYVVVLLKIMWRRLMEIMLMAKLMEIVSSIVVYVSIPQDLPWKRHPSLNISWTKDH